jgi:hypothetical protein
VIATWVILAFLHKVPVMIMGSFDTKALCEAALTRVAADAKIKDQFPSAKFYCVVKIEPEGV